MSLSRQSGLHPGASAESSRQVIRASLEAVRAHLGTEVAFVGRFDAGRRYIEFVDADDSFRPVQAGDSDALEDTYCARIADGRLPELIPETAALEAARELAITNELSIGSYISVPLRTASGEAFATFCSFSRKGDPSLRQRDLTVLRVLGDVVAAHLQFLIGDRDTSDQRRQRVRRVLDDGGPAIALQPIFDLRRDRISGYEALARFRGDGDWTPDRWFAEADLVGLGPELETAAVRCALRLLPDLPKDVALSVNVSPEALGASDEIVAMLTGQESRRLVVELTEHHRLVLSDPLTERLDALRAAGVRLAVDDAGSGYAGLEHILDLRPDVLKLDRVLIQGITRHPGRQAMCDAMVRFAGRTGARLVAEGVETEEDLQMLRHLGVRYAQGFLLGVPEIRT